MPREKECYRDIMQDLLDRYGPSLSIAQACEYTKRHRQTLLKDPSFPAKKIGSKKKMGGKYIVTAAALARYLA